MCYIRADTKSMTKKLQKGMAGEQNKRQGEARNELAGFCFVGKGMDYFNG